MKKSDLKRLIAEIVSDIVPQYIDRRIEEASAVIISELRAQSTQQHQPQSQQPVDFKSRIQGLFEDSSSYSGLESRSQPASIPNIALPPPANNPELAPLPTRTVSAPKNARTVKDGEPYASGRGILEWLKGEGGALPPENPDFNHSDDQVDNYISSVINKKL